MAIVVIGIYLGFKREFSKLIGFLVVALIAVGLVFNAGERCTVRAVQQDYWCINCCKAYIEVRNTLNSRYYNFIWEVILWNLLKIL